MIANEVIHCIRSKKGYGLLLKMDFHKAVDSILWEHINVIMSCMRFDSLHRKLNFKCLSISKITILINSPPSRKFDKKKGANPEYYITHLQYIDYTMIFLLDETLIDCMFLLKNSLVIFKPIKTQLLHLQGILPV
jgi:hypothetical protein